MLSYFAFCLQTKAGSQLDGFVVGLLIAAVGSDLVDDLVHGLDQILVALGDDDGLTEGGFLGGELEVGDLKRAVAGGDERLADRLVDDQTRDVAVLDLEGEGRGLLKLEPLALGQSGLEQLGLDGTLLCADLQTRKGFLGGVGVGVAGLVLG